MDEKPIRILESFYGLTHTCARETAGGWSAAAYRVESMQGRFFLKVYDRSMPSIRQWTDRIDAYLPALVHLSESTPLRDRIARPVPAPDGQYVYTDADHICLLFAYIDGETVGDRALTRTETLELAQIMGMLHGYGAEIPVDISAMAEDISLSFCTNLGRYLSEPDAHPDVMDGAMEPHRDMLLALCREAFALRDRVRQPCKTLCLCHTDAHNFNIMKGDRLILIDWEGLRLAPPEADLFMLMKNPYWDDFLTQYAKARPGYTPDPQMLRFYHLRRQTEDIWDSIARLLYDNPARDVVLETQEMTIGVIKETYELFKATPDN